MKSREAFVLALRSMRVARLRTALTTFGIAVGIASVILLTGLGNGMKTGFNNSLSSFATAISIFRAASTQVPGGAVRALREEDAHALADPHKAPNILTVTPMSSGTAVTRYKGNQYNTTVNGAGVNYLKVYNQQLAIGSMFSRAQELGGARVVVLGPAVVNSLFNGNVQAAMGSNVQIGRLTFTVIGTLRPGGSQISGSPDDTAVIPLTAARSLFGRSDKLTQIAVQATDVKSVPAAIDQIYAVMDQQHFIRTRGHRDYSISATLAQVQKTDSFLTGLTLFTLGIAGIALFVGGLGVANIMLVSVTERTHEIGIRKAIGARRGAILKQFIIESTVLSGVGGVAGVVLGIGATLTGAHFLPRISPEYGTPTVSLLAVLGAFGISLLLGLAAGGLPAMRAARLHPVEALRH
ncbi:MAG TPA: ABC transporter permease [Pseudonocardia sp.]|jgi:putative ABC transport system permease protein